MSSSVARGVAAVAFVLAMVGASFRLYVTLPPSGDEPHYVLLAHSLLVDHDLDLRNNYQAKDYRAFFPGDLDAHAFEFHEKGIWRSTHGIGVSLLLLPGFALAGWSGAVALLTVLSLWLAAEVALFLRGLGATTGRALAVTALIALSPPLVLYAGRAYPELPAALAVLLALRRIVSGTGWGGAWVVAAAIMLLPWLGVKFAALSIGLALLAVVRRPEWRLLTIGSLAAAAVLTAWYLLHYYGSLNPNVLYRGIGVSSYGVPYAVAGLLLDQEFGLLANGPVFAVALALLLAAWVRRPVNPGPAVAPVLLLVGITWAVASSHPNWWGGLSHAPRYLVPALPLLALPLALLPNGVLGRSVLAGLALLSLPVFLHAMSEPARHFNLALRESLVFWDAGPAGRALSAVWPSFLQPDEDWSVRRADQLAGDLGRLTLETGAPWGTVRLATEQDDDPGVLVRQPGGLWKKGASRFGVQYRTGNGRDIVGRVRVIASGAGEAVLADERLAPSPREFTNRVISFVYPGMSLLGGPALVRFEIEFLGGADLAIGDIGWRTDE